MNDLKRLKILAAVFAVTLVLAVFTLIRESPANTAANSRSIAISDTASITSVLIQNEATGSRLGLVKKGRIWLVNDRYPMRDDLEKLLLLGLNKMQVKREAPEQSRNEISQKISEKGIRVSIAGEQNIPLASFSILPNEADANSCYFMKDSDTIPYVIYVPGFSGNITNIFALQENDWRTRIFYSGTEQTLQRISVNYPEDPKNNIEIEYRDGGFHLAGKAEIDTAKFYQYVNQFARITVNSYISEGKDSILALLGTRLPLTKIRIEDIREDKEMDIYISPAADALYGIIPGKEKELVKLSPEAFNLIIAGRGLFVKKPESRQ